MTSLGISLEINCIDIRRYGKEIFRSVSLFSKKIMLLCFFLISQTEHDPMVVEGMQLSALTDVQRRYETGEPWLWWIDLGGDKAYRMSIPLL